MAARQGARASPLGGLGPNARVWPYICALALISAALWLGPLANARQPDPFHSVPWLVVAVAYAVACRVSMPVVSGASRTIFDFSGIVQAVAMTCLPPRQALAAALVGSAVGTEWFGTQGFSRRAFNLVQVSIGLGFGVLIMNATTSPERWQGIENWPGLFAAVYASGISMMAMVPAMASLWRGRWTPPSMLNTQLLLCGVEALAGLSLVAIFQARPEILALVIPLLGVLTLQTRSYVAALSLADRSRRLPDVTRDLVAGGGSERAIRPVLLAIRDTFSIESVEAIVLRAGSTSPLRWSVSRSSEHLNTEPIDPKLTELLMADAGHGRLLPSVGGRTVTERYCRSRSMMSAAVAGVSGIEGSQVLLVIGSRHTDHRSLSHEDLALLQTVAQQIAAAMDKTTLDVSLKTIMLEKDQMAERAQTDALTGLGNRTLFVDRLDQAWKRQRRSGHPMAVLFVDLDKFKEINDGLGHSAGDEMLREAARRIRATVREVDTVARFGGDEFVVLLEDLDAEVRATDVARRLVREFAVPFELAGQRLKVGLSVGVSQVSSSRATSPEELLQRADQAMYRAKSIGTNQIVIYPSFQLTDTMHTIRN